MLYEYGSTLLDRRKIFKFSEKKSEEKKKSAALTTQQERFSILHPIFSPESDPPTKIGSNKMGGKYT
jgi:hypothetical protein